MQFLGSPTNSPNLFHLAQDVRFSKKIRKCSSEVLNPLRKMLADLRMICSVKHSMKQLRSPVIGSKVINTAAKIP